MSDWKYVRLRIQAALIKGTAKDIDKSQEVINNSDNPRVIVKSINSGKIELELPEKCKKKKKHDFEVE